MILELKEGDFFKMTKKPKNQKIFFFSFFLFFLFLIPISYLMVNAVAIDDETSGLTVKSNWLYETVDNFQDSDPHSWENKISFSNGGEDLISFENLGIVSVSDTEILYKANVKFGFEITAHTYIGFRDIFPNIDLNSKYTQPFFSVKYMDFGTWHWDIHSVSWSDIDYGDIERYHEYDGIIPITVGIKDLIPPSGAINLNGISFSIPQYTYNIIQINVKDIRHGVVGDYNDIFTNAGKISEGSVELVALDDDFNAEENAIIGYYNEQCLGWQEGNIERGRTLQQSLIGASQEGTTFHQAQTKLDTPFSFGLRCNLHPEVYEYVQYNKITSAGIDYWTWGLWKGDIFTWSAPSSSLCKRVVAVHTTNNYLYWDLTVDTELYATIPVDSELAESILADPYLVQGDMVWDTSFTGEYDVSQPLTQHDPLEALGEYILSLFTGAFSFILWIIIGIVGLYIFIKLGIPYLRRRIDRGNKK